ncbi:MAG: EAL domain-containing protein, partial [Clostridia bacterium]|nr:EAL domain-containing protein [Clostridia bacterium]
LIRKLDDYIWRRTASFISEWRKRFENVVPISVNVSRVDMSDPDLPETMKAIADENGLPCEAIHLEITESAYTENAERIIETVKRLREIGFVIEMDDFGSGYSSINAVSTLPIDALKLDMALVRNGLKENGNARMLKAVIDMSASLSVPMIAEGVETEQQMLALREMGCDMVQGYYFARPMPAAEFGEYLAARLTPKG